MHPSAGAYQTKDGWLVFTLLKNEHFTCLCKALGHPELAEDPRCIGFKQR
ncbi:MAG: CoA transferase [Alphaproteobacteria bacterium]